MWLIMPALSRDLDRTTLNKQHCSFVLLYMCTYIVWHSYSIYVPWLTVDLVTKRVAIKLQTDFVPLAAHFPLGFSLSLCEATQFPGRWVWCVQGSVCEMNQESSVYAIFEGWRSGEGSCILKEEGVEMVVEKKWKDDWIINRPVLASGSFHSTHRKWEILLEARFLILGGFGNYPSP